jgi:hypothetical protein
MAVKVKTVRVELLKHVLIDGRHTPKGSKISLPRGQAVEFVSCGQAKFLDDADADTGGGVRIDEAHSADPVVEHNDPIASRRTKGGKE